MDERANARLANTLSDYANERFAAGRPVNPQLWRCVYRFMNEEIFQNIKRIFHSENAIEKEAAALACYYSNYQPALELFSNEKELKNLIETKTITWSKIAEKQ